jgi:hypothetical protein
MLVVILILKSLVHIGKPAVTRIYLSPVSYSFISVKFTLEQATKAQRGADV